VGAPWIEAELLAIIVGDAAEDLEGLLGVELALARHIRVQGLRLLVLLRRRRRKLDLEVEARLEDGGMGGATAVFHLVVIEVRALALAAADVDEEREAPLRVSVLFGLAELDILRVGHEHAAFVAYAAQNLLQQGEEPHVVDRGNELDMTEVSRTSDIGALTCLAFVRCSGRNAKLGIHEPSCFGLASAIILFMGLNFGN
jgi:hypothetical protein